GFTHFYSSHAAIPPWESDAPAHPRFSPMPLDTRRTPPQFRREIRPSRAASACRRRPPCLNPSALPLAQRCHGRPPAALLQMQSPHGGAASALRKKTFSERAPAPLYPPPPTDNAAPISAGS